jgi:hypothetical protein
MANAAARPGISLNIHADTLAASPDGGAVDVRIILNPAQATRSLNLSASTANPQAGRIKNHYERFFSNDIMAVIFEQQGNFGQAVTIAARLAPGLNTSNLVFYTYNSVANTHNPISITNYRVDESGYLHFTTNLAGVILISDGQLVRQAQ